MAANDSQNAEISGELTAKQEKAVASLLSAPTIEAAAKKCGVSESTLLRWMKAPVFAEAYRDARRLATQQAIAQIQGATGQAVDVLLSVANDATAPASARVSSARTILDLAVRGVELDDLAARVEVIEAALKDADK